MAEVKPVIETFAKIKVIGVGGGGGSAINRMIDAGVQGVEFIAVNTDVQALHHNKASKKLHIGKAVARGLGAGMNPELGRQAAEESQNEIRELLKDADMVFVTCGLGGGTGTGASSIVAEIARDLGSLTVAVVTKPFSFEGAQRKNLADRGLTDLSDKVDTIITIPNDKLMQAIDKKTSLLDAFNVVDEVLQQGVQGISELITIPGLINVDFADVKAVMANAGSALMGIGTASGENRAIEAAKIAISSPLLEMSIDGARGVLFTITGGADLGMNEVNEAAKIITAAADDDAKIIFGTVIDDTGASDTIKITVVATGFDGRMGGVGTVSSDVDSIGFESKYTPNPVVAEREKEEMSYSKSVLDLEDEVEEIPEPKAKKESSLKAAQAKPAQVKPAVEAPKVDEEDEDIGIPAFIRRKMRG